jgi:hypothetical protein
MPTRIKIIKHMEIITGNIIALQHTSFVKEKLTEMIEYLKDDVTHLNEPEAKALFEVSAEVISGLRKAFSEYERKNEDAWP